MNIYKQMNIIIDYIEEHLLEKITIHDLSRKTGLNEMVIKNIFPLLVGCGISEYIRNRKLSICIDDLKNGCKVIDVALKYGYTCSETFTRAFKKFHGVSPKSVRMKNSSFKLFSKVSFNQILMDNNIEYNIYYNQKIVLYGISREFKFDTRNKYIPLFWSEVKEKYHVFTSGNIRYGILQMTGDNLCTYSCLVDKQVDGFLKYEYPVSNYVSFKISSFSSSDISKQIIKSCDEYLKSLKFETKDIPVIEKYFDSYVELLIAIK